MLVVALLSLIPAATVATAPAGADVAARAAAPEPVAAAALPPPVAAAGVIAVDAAELAHWRAGLLAALRQRRTDDAGLSILEPSALLERAAQAQAEEMAAGGWFGFTSPAGESVEERVAAAGYNAELVTAKLYRAPLGEAAPALAERWWRELESSRQSLFHSGAREVGVGVAAEGGERFFVFVLASGPRAGDPPPALGADLASRRAEFLAALDARRAEHGQPPLRADAALDRAAQEHAAALLAALRAGRPASSVADLPSRLDRSAGGNPAIMAVDRANAGGSASYRDKTPGREGSKLGSGALGQAVLVEAMSAVEAVAAATRAGGALVAPGYSRLGVGAAIAMEGAAPHVVWVACVVR